MVLFNGWSDNRYTLLTKGVPTSKICDVFNIIIVHKDDFEIYDLLGHYLSDESFYDCLFFDMPEEYVCLSNVNGAYNAYREFVSASDVINQNHLITKSEKVFIEEVAAHDMFTENKVLSILFEIEDMDRKKEQNFAELMCSKRIDRFEYIQPQLDELMVMYEREGGL